MDRSVLKYTGAKWRIADWIIQHNIMKSGTAIKSLEKQIPKKPDTKITNRGIDITGEYDIDSDYLCPTCKEELK